MRFRPPLQAVNSISQKGSLVWSGFMFVHDGKTTLTLFRDLRLFWSTFNKNVCVSTFFCPFYPSLIFDRNKYLRGWVKSKFSEDFSFMILSFFGQNSTRRCVLVYIFFCCSFFLISTFDLCINKHTFQEGARWRQLSFKEQLIITLKDA